MTGHGYVLMDWAATAACLIAALLHLAVWRDRTIHEDGIIEAARLVSFGGYLVLGVRWLFILTSEGDLHVAPVGVLAVALTALGQSILAAANLRDTGQCQGQAEPGQGAP